MEPTVIDYETYYCSQRGGGYSLRDMTVPEYVSDPRFHVHGAAVKEPGKPARWISNKQSQTFQFQMSAVVHRAQALVSHNAQFDDFITQNVLGIRHSKPVYCTLFLANGTLGPRDLSGKGNSLEELAERLGLSAPKGSLAFMNGIRSPSPAEEAKLAAYAANDADLCLELWHRLLPKLGRPEIELAMISHSVRMFTDPDRRVSVDLNRLEQALADRSARLGRIVVAGFDIHAAKPAEFEAEMARRLAAVGETLPEKVTKTGNKKAALAKRDEGFVLLRQHESPEVAALATAWQQKKELLFEIDKLQTIRDQAGKSGRIPIRVAYHGAHTGRRTGSGGMNIQNLGRGSETRRVFRAQPGHNLIIADLSRIELCVLALLAEQTDLVEDLRAGKDVYSEFATKAFSRPVRKPRDSDSPEDAARFEKDRTAGKICVLQLGYGAGKGSLAAELARAGVKADAKALVDCYRDTYKEIPRLWERLEMDAARAVDGVSVTTGPSASCAWTFSAEAGALSLVLPSGRSICHPNVRRQKLSAWPWVRLCYGPGAGYTLDRKSLSENLCSGSARDILAEALVKLEGAGVPVLWDVHDELVCEVPAGDVFAEHFVRQVLSAVPPWIQGLPLAVEVKTSERYDK